jgi:hypothetical protein
MHNFGPSMSTRCSVQDRREGEGGLKAISWVLGLELSPRRIRVNAVLFLDSDEASNIQGAEIAIDGGATCAPSGAPIHCISQKGEKRRE